jgi:NADH dehydrogenase
MTVVLVIGSGYAGFEAARKLEKLLVPGEAEVVLISDVDHLDYVSLLPEVAAGVIDPRHNAVSLHRTLRKTRVLLGTVARLDLTARKAFCQHRDGTERALSYDRLILAPGSVPKTFPTPGLEHAFAFRTLAQAVYLRDHLQNQLEIADATDDPAEREAYCTCLVVGAGYSGTEFVAQMQLVAARMLPLFPRVTSVRWVLIDAAPRILPELDRRLGEHATKRLADRGLGIRPETTVDRLEPGRAVLSDGTTLATHTVVWTAGVTPAPLIASLDLPTTAGRLEVTPDLQVPGHPGVFAVGDAAAVPDLTKPGKLCGATAQHATRQGKRAAANVVASLRGEPLRNYRHRDLGFVVDLGGLDAAANPLGIPLSGLPAKVVTRGYHLLAIPTMANKVRVAVDWTLAALIQDQGVRLGFVTDQEARLPGVGSP